MTIVFAALLMSAIGPKRTSLVAPTVQKLLALALAAGLVASGPVCSHAQMEPCSSHETKNVPIYADLSINPADDGSLQVELPAED
jgi:hypothetical protein